MPEKANYLIVGFINTIFGYAIGVMLFPRLNINFSTLNCLIIINFISISFSFLSYKKIVFRTKGNWLKEYLKCFLVYGFNGVLSIILVWFFYEKISMQYWFAQGIAMLILIPTSFFIHKKYTFN